MHRHKTFAWAAAIPHPALQMYKYEKTNSEYSLFKLWRGKTQCPYFKPKIINTVLHDQGYSEAATVMLNDF